MKKRNLLITFFLFFVCNFSYSQDLISSFLFETPSQNSSAINNINIYRSTFNVASYSYKNQYFKVNQELDWGGIEYKMQLQSHTLDEKDFKIQSLSNQQSFQLKLNHRYGNIQFGNHTNSIYLAHNKFEFDLKHSKKKSDIFVTIDKFNIKETVEFDDIQYSLNYNRTPYQSYKLICKVSIKPFGCESASLFIHTDDHRFVFNKKIIERSFEDQNIESDDFNINYQLESKQTGHSIKYSFKDSNFGVNLMKGDVTPFADLLYLDSAINALGLGRKILYSKGKYVNNQFFISHLWKVKKHAITTQFDYTYLKIKDTSIKEYDSLLFLGFPILKNSYTIDSLSASLARILIDYQYSFSNYDIHLQASQMALKAHDSTLTDINFSNKDDSDADQESDSESQEKADTRKFEGLNLSILLKWKL